MDRALASRAALRAAAWRLLLFSFLWWTLPEDDPGGLLLGAATVVAATVASLVLTAPPASPPSVRLRLDVVGAMRLGWYFLAGSIQGGWDVALRALSPRLPVSPVVLHHSSAFGPGYAQVLFTSLLALMPGTLSVDSRGHDITIHTLVDRRDAQRRELQELEARVSGATRPTQPIGGASDG